MKKTLAIILVAIMATVCAVPAFAESTDVSYYVDPSYTVSIPAAVTLGDADVTADITASDVILEGGKKIAVELTSASNTASGSTFNAKNGDSTVTYTITGDEAIAVGDTVATFTANGSKTLTFSAADKSAATVAGAHTETLTFTLSVEETAVIKTLTIKKGNSIADSDTTIEYCEGDTWADAVERNPDKIAIDANTSPLRIVLPGKTGNDIDLCKDAADRYHLVLPTHTIEADGNYLWW